VPRLAGQPRRMDQRRERRRQRHQAHPICRDRVREPGGGAKRFGPAERTGAASERSRTRRRRRVPGSERRSPGARWCARRSGAPPGGRAAEDVPKARRTIP
jgi:hypothetical protein